MKLLKRLLLLFCACIALAAVGVSLASFPSTNPLWRLTVLKQKALGEIPEIPFLTLVEWMRPGGPTYIGGLADLPNVNASIVNVHLDAHAVEAGARIYGASCRECHGENGRGQTGPDLLAAIGGLTDWAFFSTVKWGRPGTAMIGQPLSDQEIWQVHAFIRDSALRLALGKNPSASDLPPFPGVTSDQLLEADRSSDWLTYSGDYAGLRHSKQSEISRSNVEDLRLAWAAQLPAGDPSYEATPIVTGGRMFVTQSPEGMTVLNATTGAMIWDFHRPVPPVMLCCGSSNRGVAVLGDTVFLETLDAHLFAFDVATGAKRWEIQVGNWRDGFSMTGAPLAIKNEIVIGVAGGDMGIRGFIAAYSAKDGSLLWKFDTVAGPGQPGAETWEGDSWKHGGAATWTTGTYDPDLNLIYWGTGNPSPDFSTEGRAGANLYASSVVAVDAQTGKLKWYFQFEPGDTHDWDATQEPVLVDLPWQGKTIHAVIVANRNGFFYAFNRETGQFLYGKPYAKLTWASGLAADGHPLVLPNSQPSYNGTLVWPSAGGATNWWPPSFDPQRHLLFVPSVDASSVFFKAAAVPKVHIGEVFGGSSTQRASNQPYLVAMRAIDATTGLVRWEVPLASGGWEVKSDFGGVLSTDGSLVFTGYGRKFLAFDADNGHTLWSVLLGGAIHAPPVTYELNGRQQVAIVAGRSVFTFALPSPSEPNVAVSKLVRRAPNPHLAN